MILYMQIQDANYADITRVCSVNIRIPSCFLTEYLILNIEGILTKHDFVKFLYNSNIVFGSCVFVFKFELVTHIKNNHIAICSTKVFVKGLYTFLIVVVCVH